MFKIASTLIALGSMALFPAATIAKQNQKGSAHDYSFIAIDETTRLPLSDYRGKVVLIVNVASFCGFTKQYGGLQKLYETYKDRGLVVLGVPSNDFGKQEPKAEAEIKSFCQGAFGVTFPMTQKYRVKADMAHPFYQWAAKVAGKRGAPKWNFHKYLIGAEGQLVGWYSSRIKPTSLQVTSDIEKQLALIADPNITPTKK